MSNLNLPKMTYATLNNMVLNAQAKGNYGRVKIAYETTAEKLPKGSILVRHHKNPIAEIGQDFFTLDNANWNSITTANRLNHILRDNQTTLPAEEADRLYYHVAIRQGLMVLTGWNYATKQKVLCHFSTSVCHFSRVDNMHHYVYRNN